MPQTTEIDTLCKRLLAAAPHRAEPLVVTQSDIDRAAQELSVVWPDSYRRLLLALNNITLDLFELYRVLPPARVKDFGQHCIVQQNTWLHSERELPPWMLAFYTNGLADYEGFDVRGAPGGYPIVSWSHEIAWDEGCDDPNDAISVAAPSFERWLRERVDDLEHP